MKGSAKEIKTSSDDKAFEGYEMISHDIYVCFCDPKSSVRCFDLRSIKICETLTNRLLEGNNPSLSLSLNKAT